MLKTSGRALDNASSNAFKQKRPSKVLESRHESTYRLYQSITAIRYMNPRAPPVDAAAREPFDWISDAEVWHGGLRMIQNAIRRGWLGGSAPPRRNGEQSSSPRE